MNPKIRQLLMQRAQQQAQGGQPQPDAETPQEQVQPGDSGEDQQYSLGDGQFDQNPFASILQQGGQQAQQPQGGQSQGGFQQIPKGMEQAAMMGGVMAPEESQLQKGQGAGKSKFLLGAAQQLQGYIAESTDRDEIAIARSILQLVVKLVEKDQVGMSEELDQQSQQPTQQPPMGGMQQMGGGQ